MRWRIRWRLRTTMLVVAFAGLVLRLAVHLRALASQEDEFAVLDFIARVFAPAMLLGMLLACLFLVGCFVQLVSLVLKDRDYAARLRRQDVPAAVPPAELLTTDRNRTPPTIGLGDADGAGGNRSRTFGVAAPCDRIDPPTWSTGPPIAP